MITLPALQKTFVDSFFELAWEFCIEKWQGFLVSFFLVSVSHKMKHGKIGENSKQVRGKIRGENL